MSEYFIANIRINNAVDNKPVILEGEWSYSRLVLIEFPDKDSLFKGIIPTNIKPY